MALKDNLISYWSMDEASGQIRIDSHGANDLANNGTVGVGTGINNNGATSWSESNFLSVADDNNMDATGAFSISLWIKSSAWTANSMAIMGKEATGNGWVLYLQSNGGAPVFQVNQATNHIATSSLSTDTQYHLVISCDGTDLTFYLNGSVDTAAQTFTAATASAAALNFGKRQTEARPLNSNAIVDEVAFWNRAITSDEVTEIYNSGTGLFYGDWDAAAAAKTPGSLSLLGVG